jgi:hypothetical protein
MLFSRCHGQLFLALILLFSLTACGGSGGSSPALNTGPSLSRIEVTPSQPSLAKGTTLNLTATGIYSDDSSRTLTNDVSWQSSDDTIASLSMTGGISALTAGQVSIQASLDGSTGSTQLTVTNAVLSRLEISPSNPQLALGTTLDLSALGLYSDGSSQDLTQQVSWNSANTSILTINGGGRVQTLSVGGTSVSATVAGISASQTITVSGAVLTAIEVSSPANAIPLGISQPLLALGHYSDNSLQDITELVAWQSSSPDLLNISTTSGSRGLATALAVGSVTVTATLGGTSGSITLSATAATLNSIDITPLNARLAAGTQTTFRATGHYSDGTIQDISEQAVWATTDSATANVSNATVSATLGGVTGNATLTVTTAQLLSITITPSALTLPAGTQQTVHAEGNFTDGSVQILDNQVAWGSDIPSIATVSNGLINALQPNANSARISASLSGISGSTTVTVTSATLQSLTINPSTPTLAVGTETQLQAIATYSDASQKDVTTQATWSSDDITRLKVENGAGREGRLTALATGNVAVTANLGTTQTAVSVSVGDAILTGLNIIANSTSMDSAEQQQLTVIGTFSDSTTQDLSAEAIWSSDIPSLATVSNDAGNRGQVVAGVNVSGDAVITASHGGFSSSLTLSINNTPQRPISLVVLATPNAIINNNSDASTLEIRVQAADPSATVADGTVIDLQIRKDGTPLSTQSLATTGGLASTSFTTTETGVLQVQATVNGATINNSTALYSSTTITDVIVGAAFTDAVSSGTQILNGASFGFFIQNLSNREFPLLRYELRNGPDILASTEASLDLNNYKLTGGKKLGIVITMNIGDFTDKGIEARYYLTEPGTGNAFFYSVKFTTVP